MIIKFYGAADSVTGSCHILKVNEKTILLDCGLYQGKEEELDNESFGFNPKEIDFVILSHAHIDHSGRIPLLYKRGFKGEVICTNATLDLCSAMLRDSGHIQEMEVEWRNRKRRRQGLESIKPLYTSKDAELSMYLFKGIEYNHVVDLGSDIKVIFKDAGHLLGSSIVEIFFKENGKENKLVYTGDLGNKNIPIINDPTPIGEADYVIMETTYGDRFHEDINSQLKELVSIIKDTFKRGGNVIIPSFAVGRTQEVLYALNSYITSYELKDITVFVDSPLAHEATKVFERYKNYYDEEASEIIKKGINPLKFNGLVFTESLEDSIALNKIQNNAIIISASGMCEAGRIKHHLKHNLWRKECSIVFVGYQAEGTLGRQILNGAKKVKIFGEDIAVNSHVYNLPALSGHADRIGLFKWIEGIKKKPKEIFLVHGDNNSRESFKELLLENGYNAKTVKSSLTYLVGNLKEDCNVKEKVINYLYNLDNASFTKEQVLKELNKIFDENTPI